MKRLLLALSLLLSSPVYADTFEIKEQPQKKDCVVEKEEISCTFLAALYRKIKHEKFNQLTDYKFKKEI